MGRGPGKRDSLGPTSLTQQSEGVMSQGETQAAGENYGQNPHRPTEERMGTRWGR